MKKLICLLLTVMLSLGALRVCGEDADGNENDISAETNAEMMPETVFTPASGSPYEGQDETLNYWTLPMDITDEAAVWEVLMQPITVLDRGKGYSEKSQIVVRSEPDSKSAGVGTVTCITQGVHVLEKGEEWTKIECYSSSFHDSPILNWNRLVQGYVPTSYLRTTVPNQKYGLVIDKLTQRLYLFVNGKLFSTLLVSTGLSNAKQPYNETRSGEFLLTSAVGTFKSDNLRCGYALRFNDGDLLHEVPYTLMRDGKGKDYKKCEAKLGTKASHGCIRVQRKKTPEGINMYWLWENRVKNTKMLVWEDWQGRQITVPPDDMPLYADDGNEGTYHSQDHCYADSKRTEPYASFTYAELDTEPYAALTRCQYCAPALRKAEIEAINEIYAPGGDHDPVLTEALKTCPRKLKK